MLLASLRVIHLKKGPQLDPHVGARVSALLPEAFLLDSCQRWLWVCSRAELSRVELPDASGLEVFSGVEAYSFLLRVATGLESQIVGETDIFGQLKEAWRKAPGQADLGPLMQKVFEDTKDIRSRYLQNLGGASYGSLVRMLLRHRPGPTLIVGAGQIAQSIAPYLLDGELWLANRNQENLASLALELRSRQNVESNRAEGSLRMIAPGEEAHAWKNAANVIVCIPFDEAADAERIQLRSERPDGVVIHLAGQSHQAGEWNRLPNFHPLDSLFALQKAQGDVRMTQIAQAARACDEKAKLRWLGSSVTIPHGWEDLAVFA